MSRPPDAEEIFHSARAITDAAERSRYLDEACGGDANLRALVDDLLAADVEAGEFLRSVAGAPRPDPIDEAAIRDSPGDRFGRYTLLQEIGEGGFGVVYMAEQREPVRRRVALKVVKLGMDTRQVIGRFDAERQALAMMDHPNIATVLDAGSTETGRLYFVMEYINGVSITEYCEAADLDTQERLALFIQVCHAIQHAHQKGVIHRDIKPSNVLVTLHDGVPVPKVIDFGIAKATSAELTARTFFTEHRQMIGTPAYMSPEQAEMSGLDVDTRSDIYSLGVLLYELLTGTTPFDSKELMREGLAEMLRTIREVEPDTPSTRMSSLTKAVAITPGRREPLGASQLGRTLKGDLDCIVMKCLEKDRTRRYETAGELAQDIRRYLDGEPILAAPPSQVYRLKKFARRHRGLVTAGSAVALALVVGMVGTTLGLLQARSARFEADRRADEARAASAEANAERALAQSQAYRASLFSASEALARGQVGSARQSLEAAPARLRGWEWHHLSSRLDAVLRTHEHDTPLAMLAVAPDGASYYGFEREPGQAVHRWDLRTGRLLQTIPVGQPVLWAWFLDEGSRLALWVGAGAGDPKALEIWDAERGVRLSAWPFEPGFVHSIEGSLAACKSADGLSLHDVTTGALLAHVASPTGRADFWEAEASLQPDGQLLAVERSVGRVTLIDVDSLREFGTFPVHDEAISAMQFSPDGSLLGTAGFDGTVRVLDLRTSPPLSSPLLRGHFAKVLRLSFSRDGTQLLSSSMDGTVRAWDLRSGTTTGVFETRSFLAAAAAFLPDGESLITADADGRVRFWDTRAEEAGILRGHESYVYAALVSPDGSRIYSGGWDGFVARGGSLRVWDAASGEPIASAGGEDEWVIAIALSPDGARLAVAFVEAASNRLEVFDTGTGTTLVSIPVESTVSGNSSLLSVTFDPSGERLARLDESGEAVISDVATGATLVSRRLPGDASGYPRLAWSADGSTIATCHGVAGVLSLWDAETLEPLRDWPIGSEGTDNSVTFSPDGRLVVSVGENGAARVWDAATGALLHELVGLGPPLMCAAFSPDGRRLAIGSYDGGIWLWDAVSFAPVGRLLGHEDYVFSLAWSADGEMLVSASGDHTVRIWETQPPRLRLQAQRDRRAIAEQLQPRVRGLFDELGDAARVAEALRADESLGERSRQVALQLVLAAALETRSEAPSKKSESP